MSMLKFIRHVWCALISTHRIQTVPFIGFGKSNTWECSFTTLSCTHLLSLFLLYIQIHTDLLILTSFVTFAQKLTESYLSEIYSFCASQSFSLSDQSTSCSQFLKPSYEKGMIGTITLCTQLTGFIFIHACEGITHSSKKVKMFHSSSVIQPSSRLTILN